MFKWQLNRANVTAFVLCDVNNNEVAGLGAVFDLELSVNGGAFTAGAGTKAEIGDGWYKYTNTLAEAAAAGSVAIRAWGTGTAQQNLVATVGEDLLAASVPGAYPSGSAGYALGRLSSASITITAPVGTANTITLVRGDDYLAADGRSLDFTSTSWPDLIGAAITMSVRAGSVVAITGSVVDADTCRVELTTLQTVAIGAGRWAYDIAAVLSNTHVVTLVSGTMVVTPDVRA